MFDAAHDKYRCHKDYTKSIHSRLIKRTKFLRYLSERAMNYYITIYLRGKVGRVYLRFNSPMLIRCECIKARPSIQVIHIMVLIVPKIEPAVTSSKKC